MMNVAVRPPVQIPVSPAFSSVTVKWVRHWNAHLFSFAVERPASLRFRSGEFVMLGLPNHDSKPIMRAYSIASQHYAEELEFLSIKVENGPLTGRLQQIMAGDEIYLGKKATGTLVTDALLPGKRLYMLSTGTGLAPFLSLARDPEIYDMFDDIVVVHSVRRVSDLAYHDALADRLSEDPLVADAALDRFHYIPTVTREQFHTAGRIGALMADGTLFRAPIKGKKAFDPSTDRIMLCGSTDMIRETARSLEAAGFVEGSNATPGTYVIERAFVG